MGFGRLGCHEKPGGLAPLRVPRPVLAAEVDPDHWTKIRAFFFAFSQRVELPAVAPCDEVELPAETEEVELEPLSDEPLNSCH